MKLIKQEENIMETLDLVEIPEYHIYYLVSTSIKKI
jgi:hypothetical protein